MKKVLTRISLIGAILFLLVVTPREHVLADCARPTDVYGNITLNASCTFAYTVDGADNPSNSETSTANSASITLGNYNLTLSSGQKIVAGQFIINGSGGIAIGSGQLLPGGGIWIYDQDADGWVNDWTDDTNYPRRSSTASGYRRMGLMKTTTADCDVTNGSLTNNCYSYSQSTYYAYSQSNYYAYSQSNYYAYSQSNYYAYSYAYGQAAYYGYAQSGYYSYSYTYGQANYYGYGQASYGSYACFLAGSKVLMANGSTKEIQDIKPGDVVLSYDLATGKLVPNTVAALLAHSSPTADPESAEAGYLVINGALKVTKGHNLWVASKGLWLRADAVRVGDALLSPDGSLVTVERVMSVDENPPVYNLSLPGIQHNYFVEGVLVHNAWKT